MTEVDKPALRALAAERRVVAHAADSLAGERLAEVFLAAVAPPDEAVIAGYWPFRTEIDPRPLMTALASRGHRFALPLTPPRGSAEPLSFRLWSREEVLAPGHFTVHEPSPNAPVVEPDLVLCPLLAFDRTGARLGYGQGHYDRALAGLRKRKAVVAIGLAFAAQEMERLPAEPHDVALHGIATETAYIPVMDIQA